MGDFKWFFLGLLILFALWALTASEEAYISKDKPFLEQPSPIESGRPYTLEELKEKVQY